MKKKLVSFLIMALMVINVSSVQAATDDNTIKVSLDNIKEIMIENNLDMKVLNNNLKITQINYHEARDQVEGLEDEVDSAQNNVDNFIDDGSNSAQKKVLIGILNDAKDDLADAESKLDDIRESMKTANINYDKQMSGLVSDAQQEYISYLATLSDKESNEAQAKSKEKEVQVAKIKYDSGFISKNDYTSIQLKNTESSNTSNESSEDLELAKTKLYTTLGISSSKNIIFDTDVNQDFDDVSKINYNDDLEKMLDNNLDIKLKDISIDQLDDADDATDDDTDNTDDIDDYKMDNAEISLKQQIATAETNFKKQYNTLMNSYNSMKSSFDSLNQEKNSYNIMQTKYDYGFASKKEADDAKLNSLDTANSTFQKNKNTFYVNYLRYIQMKEGY